MNNLEQSYDQWADAFFDQCDATIDPATEEPFSEEGLPPFAYCNEQPHMHGDYNNGEIQ